MIDSSVCQLSDCHTRLFVKNSHKIWLLLFLKRMDLFASLMMIQNLRFTEKEVHKNSHKEEKEKNISEVFNVSIFACIKIFNWTNVHYNVVQIHLNNNNLANATSLSLCYRTYDIVVIFTYIYIYAYFRTF